jgi:hypothetical protein
MEERRRGIDPFSKRGLSHSLTPSLKGSQQDLMMMNVDHDVQKEFVKAMKTDDLD